MNNKYDNKITHASSYQNECIYMPNKKEIHISSEKTKEKKRRYYPINVRINSDEATTGLTSSPDRPFKNHASSADTLFENEEREKKSSVVIYHLEMFLVV